MLFLVAALWFGQVSLALVGAFLLFATWAEARNVKRVVALRAWQERMRQTSSRLFDGQGPTSTYRPRWRLD